MSSVDLEQLVFKVDTKELESAVDKVEKLESAVSGLNQPLRELGEASKQAGEGLKPLSRETGGGGGGKGLPDNLERINKIIAKQVESMRVLRNESLQLKDGTIQLGDGFTKMQSNALAGIKIIGATKEQMELLAASFQEFNARSGLNTFDKSASGLAMIRKEAEELKRVNDLMSRGFNLTRNEVVLLSRDMIGLQQVFKGEELVAEIAKLEKQFVEAAQERNLYYAQAKEAEEAAKREAKLQAELQRAGMQMNDAAVAQFRKNEEIKQAALRQTNELIEQTIRQTKLINDGLNEREAKKFVQMEQQGIPVEEINRYIAAERERKNAIEATKEAQQKATSAQDLMGDEVRKLNADLQRQRDVLELLKQGYTQLEANKILDLQGKGFSPEQVNSYVTQLRAVNEETKRVTDATRTREKESRNVARALEYLTDVERRLDAQIEETNRGFNERDAAQLIKIENAIRTSGMSADQAAAKMQNLRNKIQTVADQRAEASLRNLSRAISVQMGDVAISLAGGMNPLLVMVQQGDQIRGAFEQAKRSMDGMANADMMLRQTMMNSSKMIVQGIVDTSKAIGTFFYGALITAGEGANRLAANILGLGRAFRYLELEAAFGNKTIRLLLRALPLLSGSFIGLIVVAIVEAAVAMVQFVRENDKLTMSLAKSSGTLASSTSKALETAKSIESLGVSTSRTVAVMGEMAKVGGFVSEEIALVSVSAEQLRRVGAASVEETVKQFAEMKKDPVDALIKLGIETGRVNSVIAQQVVELSRAGESSAAAQLAMKELARVNAEVAEQVGRDLSWLGSIFQGTKNFFGDLVSGIKELMYATPTLQKIASYQREIAELYESGNPAYADRIVFLESEIAKLEQIVNKEKQATEEREKSVEREKARQREQARYVASLTKEQKYVQEINRLLKDSVLLSYTQSQIADEIAKIRSQIFGQDDKKDKKAESEADKLRKRQIADMEKIADLLNRNNGLSKDFNNTVTAINRAQKEGQITEQERIQALTALVKMQPIMIRQAKELEETRKQELKDQEFINSMLGKSSGLGKDYFKTYEQIWQVHDRAAAAGRDLSEVTLRLLEALDASTPAARAAAEANAVFATVLRESVDAVQEKNDELIREREAIFMSSDAIDIRNKKLAAEIKYQKEVAKLIAARNKALDEGGDINTTAFIEAMNQLFAEFENSLSLIDENAELQKVKKLREEILNRMTGLLTDALFKDSKTAAQQLRKMIEDELKKPIVVAIRATLESIMTSGSRSGVINKMFNEFVGNSNTDVGPPESAAGKGSIPGLGSLSSLISSVGNLTSSIKMGAQIANIGGFQASGRAISGQIQAGNYSGAAGSALGAVGSFAAGYGAGKLANQVISGGFAIGDSTKLMNVGSIVGAALGGPLGAALGTAVGGVVNRLFGRKFSGSTLLGEFGQNGFTGSTQDRFKGGLFRSDKTIENQLDPALLSAINFEFKKIKDVTSGLAKTLGLSTESVDNFNKSLNLDITGLSAEEVSRKIQDSLEDVSNEIASSLLSVVSASELIYQPGESTFELLKRLGDSLTIVNMMFENLGFSLKEVSVAGGLASASFIELFGGMQEATNALNTYYQNFYSEQERVENATRNLTRGLAELGVAMPTAETAEEARMAYRKLVDDAMAAGDEKLAAGLIQLSTAFAELNPIVGEIAGKINDLQKETLKLRAELLEAEGNTVAAKEAFRQLAIAGMTPAEIAIWDLNDALRNQIEVTKQRVQIEEQIFALQATQDQLRQKELEKLDPTNRALQQMVWVLEDAKLVADERYGLETRLLQLQGNTAALRARELEKIQPANRELQKHIWALEDQAEQTKWLNDMINAAMDSWQKLGDSIEAEVKRIRGLMDETTGGDTFEVLSQKFAQVLEKARSGDRDAMSMLPEMSKRLLDLGQNQVRSLSDLRNLQATTALSLERANREGTEAYYEMMARFWANVRATSTPGLFTGATLPSFANGGNYMGGAALVGEEGPEIINFDTGGYIYDHASSRRMLDNSSVVQAIEVLNENITNLRAEVRADVNHNSKVSKLLDRVIRDGENLSVVIGT